MPQLSFLPVILRETMARQGFPREPEPDLVMEGPEQVAAYALAGRVDGEMGASYLFHAAHCSQTIVGARRVIDLGCGPATQLCQIAKFNPDTEFIGVDLSSEMLETARAHAKACGLSNVDFRQGDISKLSMFADASVDGVISTMALHHLPRLELLQQCMREIARVLAPDGAIYLTDFARLKTLRSVLFFAYRSEASQPRIFLLDYERSLRAAFSYKDVEGCLDFLPRSGLVTTFMVPFIFILKTQARQLGPEQKQRFSDARKSLPRKYRADLDDMRLFLKLGGLKGDPFSA
jgi:arsenite methyltransferase